MVIHLNDYWIRIINLPFRCSGLRKKMLALAKSSHYTVEFSPHLRPTTINNRQLFVCSAGDQVDALTKKSGPLESLKLKSLILLNALLIQLL